MSGRSSDRGHGRGRGRGFEGSLPYRGGRGAGNAGSHFSPSSFEPRGGGRGRGDRGGFGRGGGAAPKQIFSHSPNDTPVLDPNVQRVENEIQKTSVKLAQVERMPRRPAYGTRGKPVTLWANYFQMMSQDSPPLFRYDIEVHPDSAAGTKPAGRKLKRIIELLLQDHFDAVRDDIASDYKSNLISKSKLPINGQEYPVDYREEGEDPPTENIKPYRLQLHDAGTVSISELVDYLTSTNASAVFASKGEALQALNIVVGHYPKSSSDIFSIGANKHFKLDPEPSDKMSLGAGLQAIRGFFISVRAASARLLVNIQVKPAACYQEGSLEQSMGVFLEANGRSMGKLDKFLKKVRVRVDHIVRKNKLGQDIYRTKTIMSLATPRDGHELDHPPKVSHFAAGARDVHFYVGSPEGQPSGAEKEKKGKKKGKSGPAGFGSDYISVYDFFRQSYNITLRDPGLPVVNVGNRQRPTYLPAQVCQILPGQPSGSKPSPSQQAKMIEFAVRQPIYNARSIVAGSPEILGIQQHNKILENFGLSIIPRLVAVPGRELAGPAVKYRNGKSANTIFGSWNMRDIKFSTQTTLSSWTYLRLVVPGNPASWRGDEATVSATLKAFESKMKEVGIVAGGFVQGFSVNLDRDRAIADRQIDDAIRRFANPAKNRPPDVLLVILPFVDTAMYNRVKFACDVKEGLRNVCVVGSKFAKPNNDQYFANVALKFNLKLGGRNQLLDKEKLGVVGEGKTMVVGIDVTHPSPGSSSAAPSVAAIVASVDGLLGQWPADLRIQTARQEMVDGLEEMIQSRLRLWAKYNSQKYPENILVYRDGVSEGQYSLVLDKELPLIRRACSKFYPASEANRKLPRITIIVVGKRHHTRFYATKESDADRSSNPQNGTVVDRGVTEAQNWDFFLQAHAAIKGTARPAHYYIVLDEIFRGRQASPQARHLSAADALEDLTHNMCYVFGRATKAVSICPPAYYADLVCERARCYLSRLFDATPDQTEAGSVMSGSGDGGDAVAGEVRIHEKIKDTMFYI